MKKILILGAGIYQVPLIKKAKEYGLYVIIASIPGNYPGFALADKVYDINTTDYQAICQMAREEQIDAIVTTGTDVAMITIGYVCQELGLPGLSFTAAQKCTDKMRMKQAFKEGGVCTADFRTIHTMEEALIAAHEIGYPAMLKIVDRSGSRGITKVTSDAELTDAYREAEGLTFADHMLVEEYTEGHEIGIDAFIQDGQVLTIVPHEKIMFSDGQVSVPMGHICPCEIDKIAEKISAISIEDQTTKAIKALGLDNCAVNIDAFVKADGSISIIEATGRCGATGIPEVLSGYLGVDYYDMILRNALGEKIAEGQEDLAVVPGTTAELDSTERVNPAGIMEESGHPCASLLLYSKTEGMLDHITYQYAGITYRNEGTVVPSAGPAELIVELDVQPGDHIDSFKNGTQRVGQAIFTADTYEQLESRIQDFQEHYQVVLK